MENQTPALPLSEEVIDPQSPPWNRTTRRIITVAFFVLLLILLWRFQGLLVQVVMAWLVAYMLNPVINFVQRNTPLEKRTTTTLLVYLALILLLIGGIALVGVAIFNEVTHLISRVPELVDNAIAYVGTLTNNPDAVIAIGPYEIIRLRDLDWTELQGQLFGILSPGLQQGGSAAGQVASGAIN